MDFLAGVAAFPFELFALFGVLCQVLIDQFLVLFRIR
jgi:hypothetical protein